MAKLKINKGMTLVEVIIAITILTIIFVVFIGALSGGFINLISMGNKTKAVAEAQALLDYLDDSNTTDLTGFSNVKAEVDIADLLTSTYDPDKPVYYSVEDKSFDSINMKKVTVLVYYHNGQRFVTLSSVVKPTIVTP